MSDGGHVWWEDAVSTRCTRAASPTRTATAWVTCLGCGPAGLSGRPRRRRVLAHSFYPSPLADGGYDVSDYCAVDPLLGTLADFDHLVKDAAAHRIRIIVDLVPNHCSSAHPLFRAALAAAPGSAERARFIFRDGRGPGGELPPNNWISQFGGSAWTRVTEADGRPGQWYLHLFDTSQPDWDWRHPDVPALFEGVIRFWLDRGVGGPAGGRGPWPVQGRRPAGRGGQRPLGAPARTGTGPNCRPFTGPGGPSWTLTRPAASPDRGPPSARSGTTCPTP